MAPLEREVRVLRQLDDLVELSDTLSPRLHERAQQRWRGWSESIRRLADPTVVQDELQTGELVEVRHKQVAAPWQPAEHRYAVPLGGGEERLELALLQS